MNKILMSVEKHRDYLTEKKADLNQLHENHRLFLLKITAAKNELAQTGVIG